jgi:hypothetical protein
MIKVSASSSAAQSKTGGSFQELLKTQIADNTRLKAELTNKIEEVFALKNTL